MVRVHITFEGETLTQSKFNEIELSVLQYFNNVWSEVKESMELLRKGNERLIKSEICLVFIGADSLSRFAEIITTVEERKRNEDRFREWFNHFVFSDRNDVYKKYKQEINCDSFIAWKLRNSLLHFYGLPNLESEYIGFGTLDANLIEKLKIAVSNNHDGKRARVINPYRLLEVTLNGFLIQLETLKEMIEGSDDGKKEKYMRGIVKCYEIIQKEGSVYVPFSKRDPAKT